MQLHVLCLQTISPSSQISQWAESGMKLEKRVVFRLDIVTTKCTVGVRAQSGLSLRAVLEPIATHMNFDINECSLHIVSCCLLARYCYISSACTLCLIIVLLIYFMLVL